MKRLGFTIVELMIVVAIMALLVAVLLPALTRSREVAQSVQCQSNMRQIAAASVNYSVAWRGYLPNYYVTEMTWPQYDYSGSSASWAWRVDNFLGGIGRNMYRCPSFKSYVGKVPNAIAGNDLSTQGWVYGTATGFSVPAADRRLFKIDYSIFMLGFSEVRNHPRQGYPNLGWLEKKAYINGNGQPDQQPIFGEARNLGVYSYMFSVRYIQYSPSDYNRLVAATADPERNPTTNTGVFAFTTLHDMGKNLAYADGHVQRWTRDNVLADKPF